MRYLLDTHVFIWLLADPSKLSDPVLDALCIENDVAVSCVSFWEIAIKKSIGKLQIKSSITDIARVCATRDIEILPITTGSLDRLLALPFIHRDPFDRLLVATALEEDMTLVTKDSFIPKYDVPTLW